MNKDKILGVIYGAAYGDSLGALSEFCTQEEIFQRYSGGITDFVSSISPLTLQQPTAQVTDDFSSGCYLMQEIMQNGGMLDETVATGALLNWAKDPIYFENYAGENTRRKVQRILTGKTEPEFILHYLGENTNGAAMKAFVAGLMANGNREKAMEYAQVISKPTHYNSAAVAGAGAIACAVNEALYEHVSLEQIVHAGIDGAKRCRLALEEEGFISFGPFLEHRIRYAVTLCEACANDKEVLRILSEKLGTGVSIQESVAAVFGILAYSKMDFMKTLYCAVNCGGDTDTIACMAMAIVGGIHGIAVIPEEVCDVLNQANERLKMKETAMKFAESLLERRELK